MQVEGETRLLCAFDVARSSQLEVGLGYLEAIGSAAHDFDTFLCIFAQLMLGDEHAIALVGTSAYSSAKLMELRQAEAFGTLEALGTFTPTSMTVVATMICASLLTNLCIAASLSFGFILP